MKIIETLTKQIKKEGTKTVWVDKAQYVQELTEKQYSNIVKSASFFRGLGGSVTQTKNYTCAGYKVVKDVATSPDKQERSIREFKFEY